MLTQLSIRNVVLIESLDLQFQDGLNIFTGETGAGKSVLLDSLALALGIRADSSLIRKNQLKASVSAAFEACFDHRIHNIITTAGLDSSDKSIILRRDLANNGRSRAFVNDQLISVRLLKSIGEWLLEVHGQFDHMLETSYHIELLDQYAGIDQLKAELSDAYKAWKQNTSERDKLTTQFQQLKNDEEYFRQMLAELEELAPEAAEEDALIEERQIHLQADKVINIFARINTNLCEPNDVRKLLVQVEKETGKLKAINQEKANYIDEALKRVFAEFDELVEVIEKQSSNITGSPKRLEEIDERLHILREQARKHRIPTAELPQQLLRMREKIKLLDDFEERLSELNTNVNKFRSLYLDIAEQISTIRYKFAKQLASEVMVELPPLKLNNARFIVHIEKRLEDSWNINGFDQISFRVSMNPGQDFSDLIKTASGGERSRLMLALKVVLASKSNIPTILFDEIDSGVGGAVAEAIGQRLKRLSKSMQVFAITHSPQVASFADQHYHVSKASKDSAAITIVKQLSDTERLDEISRMLSGADITSAAREAAEQLITTGYKAVA